MKMAKLTDLRLAKLTPILDRYLTLIKKEREIDVGKFELEVYEVISGRKNESRYDTLKDYLADLLKSPKYSELAAYVIENMNSPTGPPSELKPKLRRYNSANQKKSKNIT